MRRCINAVLIQAASLLVTTVLCLPAASAQDFPSRPIRIVVAQAPGGINDILARIMAPAMARSLGQPVLVENRPGAGGLVGAEYVAKQMPADGYTLAFGNPSYATFQAFVKEMRFDVSRDLPPITILAEGVALLMAGNGVPFSGFSEMETYARSNPGRLNMGVPGVQSQPSLHTEAINQKRGVRISVIPYKGSGEINPALISNQIQLAWYSEGQAITDVAAHGLKVLAVTGERRIQAFPNVPTFVELGIPEVLGFWLSLHARGETPKPIVDKLYGAVAVALQQADVRELFQKNRLYAVGATPEASAKRLAEITRVYTELAKKAGIEPQ